MKLVTSAILAEGDQQFAEMSYRDPDDDRGELVMLRIRLEPEGGHMRTVECHLACLERVIGMLTDETARLRTIRDRVFAAGQIAG